MVNCVYIYIIFSVFHALIANVIAQMELVNLVCNYEIDLAPSLE